MKITDLFIKRPVLAICINLLILVAGYQSIKSLVVRQYPRSDVAVITVKTAYIGASADLVRGFISTPLERVIASADGIEYLESASQQGLSTIWFLPVLISPSHCSSPPAACVLLGWYHTLHADIRY